MKLSTLFGILLSLGLSANSFAQNPIWAEPYDALWSYSSPEMNEELEITILREQLNKIDGKNFSVGAMMHTWITRSQKENHLCENEDCIRHDLLLIVGKALETKKINEVEHSNLKLFLHKFTFKKGEITFKPIKPRLISRVLNRKNRKVSVPMLGDFETNSNFFRNRRLQMGVAADLDPEVLNLLKSAFHRKIFTLGRVTPEEYLLSKYSINQINLMSDLILETQSWSDEKASAAFVIDRVELRKKQTALAELEAQFVKDAQTGITAEELKQKTVEIENLKNELTLIDTQKKISDLNEKRYQLAVEYAQNQSQDIKAQLNELSDQIEDLEAKLEGEIIIQPATAGDLHRAAMNHLENRIETERRKKGGLNNFDGNIADLLVASYITGEIDSSTLKALLKIKDFQEIHESFLLKTGKFIWSAGRMYLMMNPYTVIPTTLVSVVVSALQKKKEYEKATSEKTFLIRQ